QDRKPGEFVESVFVPYPAAASRFAATFSPIAGRRDMLRRLRSSPPLAGHVPSPRRRGEG
ncbi:hypothetical protein ACCS83_34065, partial [Rhizobium johnstonii]|uniref:hypothetical protein n=1 Tax=Rhizobium johnstonii TaxID=3019933 RepID=UPI003F987A58